MLAGPHTTEQGFLEQLSRQGRVDRVDSLNSALAALAVRDYDVIVCESSDFFRVDAGQIPQPASTVLETIGQGVCIVGLDGELRWANLHMLGCPKEVQQQVCGRCREAFEGAGDADSADAHLLRARRFTLSPGEGQHYEVTATPVVDKDNRVNQIAAVVWDVSHIRRMQGKIDAIDKAGRELVHLDGEQIARLDMHERLTLLEEKIVRYTRDLMHFDNFAIRVLNKETNRLDLVLSSGLTREGEEIDLYASSHGNGISGHVAETGGSYICPDVQKDPRYVVGIEGARSSLTVPFFWHDQIVGVFNIENDQVAAFSEDDRQIAEIFGRYVAIALHILNLLAAERYATAGTLGDNVLSEISTPVNDILTELTTLKEEYIGHDDLRHRLDALTDQVTTIREAIRRVTRPEKKMIGAVTSVGDRDPTMEGKVVLVADDENVIRETVRDVLIRKGCVVETARNGNEAIMLVRQRKYDLVLSDIRMPGKDGYSVFAATKETHPDCPVILMTGFGYDPNHSIIKARHEGLAAVLFKPFKVDQLLSEIQSAFASSDNK